MTPPARLSVVVLTHNRPQELRRCLADLAALAEQPPVLVVDNGSDPGTGVAEIVRSLLAGARLLALPANLGAAARNVGVAAADSRYVAFCDDDTAWSPGSLSLMADALDAAPRVGVLTARIVVGDARVEDPICEELRESPLPRQADLPGPALVSFLAGASVVRRAAFLAAGGFHPRLFLGGEEELLSADLAAAGWAIAYLAEAEVRHWPSPARDATLRRRHGIRNTLWFTWLRRPLPAALRRTVALARTVPKDAVSLAAFRDALGGLPWVLRERHVVPAHVEQALQLVEDRQLHSRARRYVS